MGFIKSIAVFESENKYIYWGFFLKNFIGSEPAEWLPRSHDKDLLWLINIHLFI